MSTTIRINKDTKEALSLLKEQTGESYDKIIKSLLGGVETNIPSIEREALAFELGYRGFDAHGNTIERNYHDVTFKDLQNAEVGDEFYPQEANLQNYDVETLKVIYKDNNSVLCKLEQYHIFDGKEDYREQVINVFIL